MDTLALYIYPVPHGTAYNKVDLSFTQHVKEIFDYCQILEASISKQGWDFLIGKYGYEELFYINQNSGWFDCSSIAEFILCVESEIEISPDTF